MTLPKQVVASGSKANDLIKGLSGDPVEQTATETPDDQTPRQDAAPVEPRSPATGTEVQPDAAGVEHDWKKRFANLQSTHQATAAELKQARAEAKAREAELLERIEALEAKAQAPAERDRSYLSEDELTLFGEDNLELVERVAERIAEQKLAALRQQQARENERLDAQRQAANAESEKQATFLNRLKNTVADFDMLDTHPEFKSWLEEADELAGVPRAELLRRAYQSFDVGRVAQFYNDFGAQIRRADPREALVQPKPSSTPEREPGDPAQGRIWSRAEVDDFYKQKKLGKFRFEPERARAIENEIFAALNEGRVRG